MQRSLVAARRVAAFAPRALAYKAFQLPVRTYSVNQAGSNSDFAPKVKQPENDQLQEAIAEMKKDIAENRVVLFMKGEPKNPQCGFSARVVQILAGYGVKYVAYNVLADPLIRSGVKIISDWPTIPQMFVEGEFIGGCDILTELHQNGELKAILEEKK